MFRVALAIVLTLASLSHGSSCTTSYTSALLGQLQTAAVRQMNGTASPIDERQYGLYLSMSPAKLFRERFGPHASSGSLVKLASTLSYVGSPNLKMNATKLREFMHRSALTGRLARAQEALGKLLLLRGGKEDVKRLMRGISASTSVEKRCLSSSGVGLIAESLMEELQG